MLKSLRDLFCKDQADPEVDNGPVTLANVLDRGWMDLFYQPKIELRSTKLEPRDWCARATQREELSVQEHSCKAQASTTSCALHKPS